MSENDKPGESKTTTGLPTEQSITQEAEKQLKVMDDIIQARITSNDQLIQQKKILEEINNSIGDAFEAQKNAFSQYQLGITEFSKAFQEAQKNGLDLTANLDGIANQFKDMFAGDKGDVFERLKELAKEGDFKGMEKLKGDLTLAESGADKFNTGMLKLGKSMGLSAKFADTFAGSITHGAFAFAELDPLARGKQMTAMAASFNQMTSAGNIASMVLTKLVQAANDARNAGNDLVATFGDAGLKYELTSTASELTRLGMTMQEQSALSKSLAKNFQGFYFETRSAKDEIMETAGALEKFGISGATTGAMMNKLTRGLGMSSTEVLDLTVSLQASAKAFGMTGSAMVEAFKSSAEKLAAYGKDMKKVFQGLMKEAARTGIEVSKLIAVSEKFDAFSTAAETSAQMNALFGTSLSAMGMHAMDSDQRMEELNKQFRATGMSVDSLNKYQLKALAKTLGVTVLEATQMLGGELTANQKEQLEFAESSKELNRQLSELGVTLVPLMKQLNNVFASMFQNEDTLKAFIAGIESISGAIVAMTANFKVSLGAGIFAMLGAKLVALYIPTMVAAGGFMKMGLSARVAMGTGLGLLLTGLAALAVIVYTRKSPYFYLLFGVMAVGILAMGQAAQMSQAGLYALATVLFAMGFAFSGIFYTLSLVIDSFTNMIVQTAQFADVIPTITLAVIGLAAGLYMLGASGTAGMVGMAMAAVGLFAILAAFSLTGQSVGDFIKGGGDEIAKIGAGIAGFGTGMEKLMVAAASIKSSLGDTMMMASMEGNKMSLVVGKNAAVAKLFKNDTLNIKVDMPKIVMPTPEFVLKIDGREIEAIVERRENRLRR